MRTTIYLVRHGETEFNVEHRMQGHLDSPLTPLGVSQAEWLGESLRDVPFDLIYASSSPRAVRTAELIRGSRQCEIIECDSLKEMKLGIWEGKTRAEVMREYPEHYHFFTNDPERFELEGAETFRDVNNRAVNKLRQAVRENEGKSILIVSHSVVVKLIMSYFEARPLSQLWNPPFIHPACLSKIEIENDQAHIVLHGDASHYKSS